MTTTADIPASARSRPLALRMRPDLEARSQHIAGELVWHVKDPVALAYFQFRREEYAILRMLDGRTSPAEIVERFEGEFAPRRLSLVQLQAFVARLHRDGLLVTDTPGQGIQLLDRHQRRRREKLAAALVNVLAIRLPGFNAEPLLARLDRLARWFFSPVCLALCLALMLSAAALVAAQFDAVLNRLPDFDTFFTARGAMLLVIALAAVKVLHELGHALACRRFGGECHELGVMFLVFTPCLYCNVSDSWMLPSKWQRMAISAAGMYVEGVLAAAAVWLWWFSEPGLFNALALNTVVVCSVSTLIFNGNPLLRYDGYYLLADWIEMPNLAERAGNVVREEAGQWCLGLPGGGDGRDDPAWRRGLLALYWLLSTIYRFALVGALLWVTYKALRPYHLERLAEGLAWIVLGGMLGGPARRAARFVQTPTPRPLVKRWRLLATGGLVALVVAVAVAVPLPSRVTAPVVVEPAGARSVYVSVPGTLRSALPAGARVDAGATIAQLENLDIVREVTRLAGECSRQRLHVENLERRRVQDPTAASEIPTAREALADLEQRLEQRHGDQRRLTLTAPIAGELLPPPTRRRPQVAGELTTWSGTPLDPRNLGSYLETGTLVCQIGDSAQLVAEMIVDQSDIDRVDVGQRAEIKLDETPGETLWGTVREVAKIDLGVAPRELARGDELPIRADEAGRPRPAVTSYEVRIELDEPHRRLLLGTRGRGKIYAPPQSAWQRLRRHLSGTFRFQS